MNNLIKTKQLATSVNKYAVDFTFTGGTTSTITHNLGTTDVLVQIKNSSGELIIPNTVSSYSSNSVDVNVLTSEIMRVIIIG